MVNRVYKKLTDKSYIKNNINELYLVKMIFLEQWNEFNAKSCIKGKNVTKYLQK